MSGIDVSLNTAFHHSICPCDWAEFKRSPRNLLLLTETTSSKSCWGCSSSRSKCSTGGCTKSTKTEMKINIKNLISTFREIKTFQYLWLGWLVVVAPNMPPVVVLPPNPGVVPKPPAGLKADVPPKEVFWPKLLVPPPKPPVEVAGCEAPNKPPEGLAVAVAPNNPPKNVNVHRIQNNFDRSTMN